MKLLITADLHLNEDEPERLEVFQWLVDRGLEIGVDAMLIGGDMFDSNHAYQSLKGELLPHLQDTGVGFPIFTVPGNHDSDLSSSSYLDEGIRVLDERSGSATIDPDGESPSITGIPYRKGKNPDFRKNEASVADEGPNILLTHGSLIDPDREYIFQGIDRQKEENDHLIFRKDFAELNYDIVVLGHWHQADHLEGENTDFLYPGSPVPTSKRELGRKWYWVLEIENGGEFKFRQKSVDSESSWYYRKETLFSVPNYGTPLSEEFQKLLKGIEKDPHCSLIIEIDGFVSRENELELKGELGEIRNKFEDDFYGVQLDWKINTSGKLDEPFPSRFIEKITQLDGSDVDLDGILGADEAQYADLFRKMLDEDLEEVKKRALRGGLEVIYRRLD